jgi:hypothetical protein
VKKRKYFLNNIPVKSNITQKQFSLRFYSGKKCWNPSSGMGSYTNTIEKERKVMKKAHRLMIPLLVVISIFALLATMVTAKPDLGTCECGCGEDYDPWCGCGILCRPMANSNGRFSGNQWPMLPPTAQTPHD